MKTVTISEQEYEQLKEENRILKELVATLTAKITELEAVISELKAAKKKNSKNSSKPPSSDGLKKGKIKNNRTSSGRPSGGQIGHEGVTKELSPTPDTVVELKPITECECGGKVVVHTENYTVRQVTDIQRPKLITIEYHTHNGVCDKCGKVHKASFPGDVNSTISYGDNLQAIVTYLTVSQLLPLKRTTELMKDLFGVEISQGTIVASGQEAYEELEEPENRAKEEIIDSEVAQFDESGMRVEGKTWWLHSASTDKYTYYAIHEKRGTKAMDEINILPLFKGTAVHDHWKSYYHYDNCAHAECNAHHLRHLKFLYEDLGEAWTGEMACLLLRIKRHVDLSKLFGADCLEQTDIDTYERIYKEILDNAATQEQPPTESRRMAKRMKEYEQETLLFMLDFSIPFTNNLAERDIRMPKAKQKISGCFRSEDGAKAFARIRGFISTVKKNGKDVLDGLVSVFNKDSMNFLFPDSN